MCLPATNHMTSIPAIEKFAIVYPKTTPKVSFIPSGKMAPYPSHSARISSDVALLSACNIGHYITR